MTIRNKIRRLFPFKLDRIKAARLSADMDTVREHFDAKYYLSVNGDVASSRVDPLRHFCEFGWRELRDPCQEFSVRDYLLANVDIKEQGINPFVHYISKGRTQSRKGKYSGSDVLRQPGAEGVFYAERKDLERAFDSDFYLQQNPDVLAAGWDPLDHYLHHGWREGRDPAPFFSTSFYLDKYPDIRSANVNPFWHFVVCGKSEGRVPKFVSLLEGNDSRSSAHSRIDDESLVIRAFFDEDFYLRNYPEVREFGVSALAHFCIQGWKDGKDPSAEFSVSTYLDLHADVAASGVNPFWHYLVAGKDEGRVIASAEDRAAGTIEPVLSDGMKLIEAHFDAAFYTFNYVDVVDAAVDPLAHYWYYGWKEGRDPSAVFSTTFYLETNPDVANRGINPLWHYILAGKKEGRLSKHPGGYRAERLRNLDTLEDEVGRWTHRRVPERLISGKELATTIMKSKKGRAQALIVSVGHDQYQKVSGGVQVCEHREEVISALTGRTYLQLHPWQALPRLAHLQDGEDPIVCLVLNGQDVGAAKYSDVVHAVSTAATGFGETQIVIHQLLGHLPERIADLVHAAGRKDCWLWLHDFLTICPSYTLQRNNVSFCGAPPLGSNACTLCRFGNERRTHVERVQSLFDCIDLHVLSPSQVTADFWSVQSGLTPASLRVLPHKTLKWLKRAKQLPTASDRTTIGFLGTPAPHKGWQVFELLFRRLGHLDNYRFVFLGATQLPASGIYHRRVQVTASDPDAMITAVQEERIDLVLHWATWPETFSLSTYEAYAGGAYVITNEMSGNVAATVRHLGRGAVLAGEKDLQDFFEDGRAEAIVLALRSERRRFKVTHELSRMVHDAIDLAAIQVRP